MGCTALAEIQERGCRTLFREIQQNFGFMSPENWSHKPVLPEEVQSLLITDESGTYVDATIGMGGHSRMLLSRMNASGRIIGLDWDPEMAALARTNLAPYGGRVKIIEGNFADISGLLAREGVSS